MKKLFTLFAAAFAAIILMPGCQQPGKTAEEITFDSLMQAKVNEYAVVRLTADLSVLTEKEKQMIPMLIEVARIMDDLFWQQALIENKTAFLDSIANPDARCSSVCRRNLMILL